MYLDSMIYASREYKDNLKISTYSLMQSAMDMFCGSSFVRLRCSFRKAVW